MTTDPLYLGFRLGIGLGLGLFVFFLSALIVWQLVWLSRLLGEWIGAVQATRRRQQWLRQTDPTKKE
jgi:hypothetical protein